jgi:DNA helicase-2/ATP-dependent DNA helicase PcrA
MTIMSDDNTEVEEERRLAYVGITRAKEDLTISAAKQRMLRGETQYNPVSRFVKEIPQELLDNRLPVYKRDFSDYEDDSYERVSFKQKPYDFTGRTTVYKTPLNTGSGMSVFGTAKPKAVLKKKTTPENVKPFIAQATAVNKTPSGAINYTVGDRVRHSRFGDGTVLAMEPGPKDTKVTVHFDEGGQKIMYATFAKLVKI